MRHGMLNLNARERERAREREHALVGCNFVGKTLSILFNHCYADNCAHYR